MPVRAELEQALEVLRGGGPESLDHALVLLRPTVLSFSKLVCRHEDDAEDNSQEVLLKAAQHLADIEDPRALSVWLYRVAKNRCLMTRRKSKFAPAHELSVEGDEIDAPDTTSLDKLAGPEAAIFREEIAGEVQRALDSLPAQHRVVLLLHDFEELPTPDIAKALGTSEGNVRVRLHRARTALRELLSNNQPVAR